MKNRAIASALAFHHKISRDEAASIIDTLTNVVGVMLHQQGRVKIAQLGRFNVVARKARKAKNPKTGETVDVPERLGVRFVPAPDLLDKVKNSPAVAD